MSSRGRKRAARRKRKRGSADRSGGPAQPEGGAPTAAQENGAGPAGSPTEGEADAEARGISRSELKNQLAREQLEPLVRGERPAVITIGAVISALVAMITLGAYLAGAEVGGDRPHILQVLVPSILFGVMAAGMWQARYWATLGFQAVLALLMVGSFLTLIAATSAAQALTAVLVLVGAGTMFWFMVKAMARIQLPSRRPRD